MKKEEWREFMHGGKRYRVSDQGRVASENKILSQFSSRNGYLSVGLWDGKSAKPQYVHRLVAKAFIPNPENKPQVNHIDGTRDNNWLENLEWVTNGENAKHSYDFLERRSQSLPGVKNPRAKINDEIVRTMRRECVPGSAANGFNATGRRFGISGPLVRRIFNRKAWKHVA